MPAILGVNFGGGGDETLEKQGRKTHGKNLLEEFAERICGPFVENSPR